jgi:hypothetical protein
MCSPTIDRGLGTACAGGARYRLRCMSQEARYSPLFTEQRAALDIVRQSVPPKGTTDSTWQTRHYAACMRGAS